MATLREMGLEPRIAEAQGTTLRDLGLTPRAPQDVTAFSDEASANSMGQLRRGFAAGRLGSDANALAADMSNLRAAGRIAEADELSAQIAAVQQRQGVFAQKEQDVTALNWNPGRILDYGLGVVGQGAASMLDPAAAAAGLSTAGRVASAIPLPTTRVLGAALSYGAPLAAGYLNYRQNKGEFVNDAYRDPETLRTKTAQEIENAAMFSGAASGALDTILPAAVGSRIAGRQGLRALSGMGVGARTALDMGGEGLTEVAQGEIKRGTLGYLNPNRDTSGDTNDRWNDLAGGILGAGPFSLASNLAAKGNRRLNVVDDPSNDVSGKGGAGGPGAPTALQDSSLGAYVGRRAKEVEVTPEQNAWAETLMGSAPDANGDLDAATDAQHSALLKELGGRAAAGDEQAKGYFDQLNAKDMSDNTQRYDDTVALAAAQYVLKGDGTDPALVKAAFQAAQTGRRLNQMVSPSDMGGRSLVGTDTKATVETPETAARVKALTAARQEMGERVKTTQQALVGALTGKSNTVDGRGLAKALGEELIEFGAKSRQSDVTRGDIERTGRLARQIVALYGRERAERVVEEATFYANIASTPLYKQLRNRVAVLADIKQEPAARAERQKVADELALLVPPDVVRKVRKDGADFAKPEGRAVLLNLMESVFDGTASRNEAMFARELGPDVIEAMRPIVGQPLERRAETELEEPQGKSAWLAGAEQFDGEGDARAAQEAAKSIDRAPGTRQYFSKGRDTPIVGTTSSNPFVKTKRTELPQLVTADDADKLKGLLGRASDLLGQQWRAPAATNTRGSKSGTVKRTAGRDTKFDPTNPDATERGSFGADDSKNARFKTEVVTAKSVMDYTTTADSARLETFANYLTDSGVSEHTLGDLDPQTKKRDAPRGALYDIKELDDKIASLVESTPKVKLRAGKLTNNPEYTALEKLKAQRLALVKDLVQRADVRVTSMTGRIEEDGWAERKRDDFKPTEDTTAVDVANAYFEDRYLVVADEQGTKDQMRLSLGEFRVMTGKGASLVAIAAKAGARGTEQRVAAEAEMNLVRFSTDYTRETTDPTTGKKVKNDVAVPADKIVSWVMGGKTEFEGRGNEDAEARAKNFRNALMSGIAAMMQDGFMKGSPYMIDANGKRESFSAGMPPSLHLGPLTQAELNKRAEKAVAVMRKANQAADLQRARMSPQARARADKRADDAQQLRVARDQNRVDDEPVDNTERDELLNPGQESTRASTDLSGNDGFQRSLEGFGSGAEVIQSGERYWDAPTGMGTEDAQRAAEMERNFAIPDVHPFTGKSLAAERRKPRPWAVGVTRPGERVDERRSGRSMVLPETNDTSTTDLSATPLDAESDQDGNVKPQESGVPTDFTDLAQRNAVARAAQDKIVTMTVGNAMAKGTTLSGELLGQFVFAPQAAFARVQRLVRDLKDQPQYAVPLAMLLTPKVVAGLVEVAKPGARAKLSAVLEAMRSVTAEALLRSEQSREALTALTRTLTGDKVASAQVRPTLNALAAPARAAEKAASEKAAAEKAAAAEKRAEVLIDREVDRQAGDLFGNLGNQELKSMAAKQEPTKASKTPTFDTLPAHKPGQKTMVYAGIGSRETPPEVMDKMKRVAARLTALGYTLSSGGAAGADSAFESGAGAAKQIFRASQATEQTRAIAREIHPAPGALKEVPLNLMARNTNQIFGANLDSPVDFVLTWTKDGAESTAQRTRETGGTGQAIDMASRKGVPVINMANPGWEQRVKTILDAKAETKPAAAEPTAADRVKAMAQGRKLNQMTAPAVGQVISDTRSIMRQMGFRAAPPQFAEVAAKLLTNPDVDLTKFVTESAEALSHVLMQGKSGEAIRVMLGKEVTNDEEARNHPWIAHRTKITAGLMSRGMMRGDALVESYRIVTQQALVGELAARTQAEKSVLARMMLAVQRFVDAFKRMTGSAEFSTLVREQLNAAVEQSMKPAELKAGYKKVSFQEAVDADPQSARVLAHMSTLPGVSITGSIVLAHNGTIYRDAKNMLHDLDFMVAGTKAGAEAHLKKAFPNAVQIYDFNTSNGKVDSYLVPPPGAKVVDIERTIGPSGKGEGKVTAFKIERDGKIVGRTWNDATGERKEGDAGTFVDFFTGTSEDPATTIPFTVGDKQLRIPAMAPAHIFHAKLSMGRDKDLNDYARYVPNAGRKLNQMAPGSAFLRWFGRSKVVDAQGKPLVVYHGTNKSFDTFDRKAPKRHAISLPGLFFTPSTEFANDFAGQESGSNVMPVYLRMENPLELDMSSFKRAKREDLEIDDEFDSYSIQYIKEKMLDARLDGHDGVIIKNWNDGSGPVQYVVFKPEHVKSATGNNGAFDLNNPDIRRNAQATQAAAGPATQAQVDEAKAYIAKVLGPQVLVEVEKTLGSPGNENLGEWIEARNVIQLSLASGPLLLSVAHHEAMHGMFSSLLKNHQGARDTLERAMDSPRIRSRLEALLADHPAALAAIQGDTALAREERVAYAYQFWAAGELVIDKVPATFFAKVRALLRTVFGMVRDSESALAIMTAFHDGKLAEPSAAGEVLTKIMARQTWNEDVRRKFDKQIEQLHSTIAVSNDVLRKSESAKARDLADVFFSNPGRESAGSKNEGYLNARTRVVRQYTNFLYAAVKGLNEKEMEDVVKLLQQPDIATTDIVNPIQRKAVGRVRALLQRYYEYATQRKVDGGPELKLESLGENYFPRVWDPTKLISDRDKFTAMLMQPKYDAPMATALQFARALNPAATRQDIADLMHQHLVNKNGVDEKGLETDKAHGDIILAPFFASQKSRSFQWLDPADVEPFLEKDLVGAMTRYLHQGIRAAEFARRFGNGGQRLRELTKRVGDTNLDGSTVDKDGPIVRELREAAEAGKVPEADRAAWVTRRMEDIKNSVAAHEGSLGSDISPTWRTASSLLMAYQNLRLLPLSLFAAFADPFSIAARGDKGMAPAFDAMVQGMKDVWARWKDAASDMPEERVRSVWDKMAEASGVVDSHMFLEQIGKAHTSEFMTDIARRSNRALFMANGLTAWDRSMRVTATKHAAQFIADHKSLPDKQHSARWLAELSLKPADVHLDAEGNLLYDRHQIAEATGMDMVDATKAAEKIQYAITRWVEGAVLSPTAAQRPTWASDPRFAVLFHLKQFTYSFHDTVLRRAANEAKNGNMQPVWALMGAVPTMMVSDVLKGFVAGGGSLPAYMKSWGFGDHLMHGISRAGLGGIGELGVDGLMDPAKLLGPSVEQAVKIVGNPADLGANLKDAIPGVRMLGDLPGFARA